MPLSFWLDHFLDSRSEIHQMFAFFFILKTQKSNSEINWSLSWIFSLQLEFTLDERPETLTLDGLWCWSWPSLDIFFSFLRLSLILMRFLGLSLFVSKENLRSLKGHKTDPKQGQCIRYFLFRYAVVLIRSEIMHIGVKTFL